MVIRSLRPEDAGEARELVEAEIAGTPYGELPRWALDTALRDESDEALGYVAADGDLVIGLALYGLVAGAQGAGRLILVAVTAGARLRGVGAQLVDAAVADLGRRGARFAGVEFPADPVLRPGLTLLMRSGFREESRVADFFRDGVDLVFLRRKIEEQR
jgi:ribosomal protein S18 acetylase RimI-like enzyme